MVVCQLVCYLGRSPPGSGFVSEPASTAHGGGGGVEDLPARSLMDLAGCLVPVACTRAFLTNALVFFIFYFFLLLRAITERGLRRRLSLEFCFVGEANFHIQIERTSPPQGPHSQSLHTSAQSSLVKSVEAFLYLS